MASIYIETTSKDSDYLNEGSLKSFFSALSMEELQELTVTIQTLIGLVETEIGGRPGLTQFTKNIPGFLHGTADLKLELNSTGSMNPRRDVSINISLTNQNGETGVGPGPQSLTIPSKGWQQTW